MGYFKSGKTFENGLKEKEILAESLNVAYALLGIQKSEKDLVVEVENAKKTLEVENGNSGSL